jgi:hypothetical protein
MSAGFIGIAVAALDAAAGRLLLGLEVDGVEGGLAHPAITPKTSSAR